MNEPRDSALFTHGECQRPPRGVGIPSSLSFRAIAATLSPDLIRLSRSAPPSPRSSLVDTRARPPSAREAAIQSIPWFGQTTE